MNNQCNNCESDITDVLPIALEYDLYIFWKKWIKDKQNDKIKISKYNGTVFEAIQELHQLIRKFKTQQFQKCLFNC